LGVDFEITPKLRFAGYKGIHDNKKKMLASGFCPNYIIILGQKH
jgi:hypothetical protein